MIASIGLAIALGAVPAVPAPRLLAPDAALDTVAASLVRAAYRGELARELVCQRRRRHRRRQHRASPAQEPAASTESDGGDDAAHSDAPRTGSASAVTDSERPPGATSESSASAPSTGSTSDRGEGGATEATEDEPDLSLLRQRAQMTRAHRALGIATWLSMGATTALGTMLALNQPTWFGKGWCNSGNGYNVLGDFGCGPLGTVHEISAFVTAGLYTATGVVAISMPDPEHASAGNDHRASTVRLHKAMAWIHLIGMLVEPILGAIAVVPAAVGAPPNVRADVSTSLRTIHVGVGYVTFAALTTGMLLEL